MSKITRRDFINGTLMAAGSSILSLEASGQAAMVALDPSYYPPARTGLRGSHPGSNEHAHGLAWAGRSDWGPVTRLAESYDLVVVGGGISGLAAACFYQQAHGRDKRVLILDNHDDFGGHARRNEHTIGRVMRISYGGSQTIVEPKHADEIVLNLCTTSASISSASKPPTTGTFSGDTTWVASLISTKKSSAKTRSSSTRTATTRTTSKAFWAENSPTRKRRDRRH
jgi:spermidine dehydrogenase